MSSSPFDHLPVIDPGKPDLTSVPRFLWWIGKKQSRIVLTGTFFGILNLLCVAVMPGVQSIKEAIRLADVKYRWVGVDLMLSARVESR